MPPDRVRHHPVHLQRWPFLLPARPHGRAPGAREEDRLTVGAFAPIRKATSRLGGRLHWFRRPKQGCALTARRSGCPLRAPEAGARRKAEVAPTTSTTVATVRWAITGWLVPPQRTARVTLEATNSTTMPGTSTAPLHRTLFSASALVSPARSCRRATRASQATMPRSPIPRRPRSGGRARRCHRCTGPGGPRSAARPAEPMTRRPPPRTTTPCVERGGARRRPRRWRR